MSATIAYQPTTVGKILKYKKKLEKVDIDDESKVSHFASCTIILNEIDPESGVL